MLATLLLVFAVAVAHNDVQPDIPDDSAVSKQLAELVTVPVFHLREAWWFNRKTLITNDPEVQAELLVIDAQALFLRSLLVDFAIQQEEDALPDEKIVEQAQYAVKSLRELNKRLPFVSVHVLLGADIGMGWVSPDTRVPDSAYAYAACIAALVITEDDNGMRQWAASHSINSTYHFEIVTDPQTGESSGFRTSDPNEPQLDYAVDLPSFTRHMRGKVRDEIVLDLKKLLLESKINPSLANLIQIELKNSGVSVNFEEGLVNQE